MRKCRLMKGAAAAALSLVMFAHAGAAEAATVYKATDDDTFWGLSKRFGVAVKQLMKANPSVDPLNIYAGLSIFIPKGKLKSPVKQVPSKVKALRAEAANDAVASIKETITIDGKPVAYSDAFQVKATAYTASAVENGSWGAVDYFGNPLKLGTIAVDPKRIRLGTKVFITGYDYNGLPQGGMIAVASDKGGSIKGNRIDIFVPHSRQQARMFGYQYVNVFILE